MKLPFFPRDYSQRVMTDTARALEKADRQNHKRDREVEIGNGDLILTDTATGTRYAVRVTSGTLGITSL